MSTCEPRRAAAIEVLKLGSSVLRNAGDYATVARALRERVATGRRAVVVVSAPGGTTEALLRRARRVATRFDDGDVARLLSKGEEASAVLLAMALRDVGVPTRTVDRFELALRTTGSLLDGDPDHIDVQPLLKALEDAHVLVVPGFVGTSLGGEPSLLGRGGSDLTALFLAHALGADGCLLVKDVPGLLPSRPTGPPPHPPAYERASWDELLERGGELVQPRAVQLAKRLGLSFHVGTLSGSSTRIGAPDACAGHRA